MILGTNGLPKSVGNGILTCHIQDEVSEKYIVFGALPHSNEKLVELVE